MTSVIQPESRRARRSRVPRAVRVRMPGLRRPRPSTRRRGRAPGPVAASLLLAARAVRGAVAPVVGVISPLGWIVLIAGVAALLAGAALGWLEFVALGAVLLAAPIVSIAFLLGRAAYRIVIELEPRRVVAGDRALGRLVIANTRPRRSSPSRLELPVGAGSAEFVVPALSPGEEHDELFAVPTERRAVIVAGPAVSVRGDQLGILRRAVAWGEPVELFVHPRTARLAPSAAGLVRDLEGEVTKTITNHDISFHALRAYEPGDDRRYVHWRTSARTGQLMVRQFEETRRSQLVILLDADREKYASEEEFELAVSIVASLGVQVIRDGTRVAVVSETRALRTATITTLLDDSCRLEPVATRHASARDFARAATLRLPAPSLVVLVGGSGLAVTDARAVQTLFGRDAVTIGLRADQGAASRIATVDRLRVATVGSLADLPRLVRRMS